MLTAAPASSTTGALSLRQIAALARERARRLAEQAHSEAQRINDYADMETLLLLSVQPQPKITKPLLPVINGKPAYSLQGDGDTQTLVTQAIEKYVEVRGETPAVIQLSALRYLLASSQGQTSYQNIPYVPSQDINNRYDVVVY